MNPIEIVLIVAGVGYVLARRMLGELLEIKALLILPVVLTVVGLTQLHHVHVDAPAALFIALGIALSVGLGLLRGRTVHLGERDGHLWMRYRVSSVVLWVVNIAVKGLFVPIERAVSPAASSAADHAILLSIGLGILAESAVVLLRAMGTRSTVVWSKGEDGAAHTLSPAFDRARSLVAPDGGRVDLRKRLRSVQRDW